MSGPKESVRLKFIRLSDLGVLPSLKREYGITLADYNAMVGAQAGKCGVCGCEPEKLVVDHCHATNYVRGLLCSKCNAGIGFLDDRPEIVQKALAYVSRHAQLRLVG